ncbi:MAG: NAD(P)/FAD-dependent oxidoreductase [Myxococcales bacterium]|nr:NAD(P)/FAD-dependent oxidoreductase [Myxococcales bacterium]
MVPPSKRPHLVIVGAGFGGLYAARALRRAEVRVTVIDRSNHHLFQPLLYQVATAVLNTGDIAAPIRAVLRSGNVAVILSEARSIDLERKRVICSHGEVAFDLLIVATGASHSYFGHDEWAGDAPGLKTLEDALRIRRRVLLAYELAEREADLPARRDWLTFVIVGGGPTGVELAGALAEIARHALARDFRNIDPTEARVILLEGQDRLLTAWPPELSDHARRSLERLGVQVRTGAMVTAVDGRGVGIGEERISARTVLWAAGVEASPLAKSLGAPLDRAGRVKVTPELTVPGREDVFVVGDLASLEIEGHPVPGLAGAAIQEGRHAARNVLRSARGQPLLPFRYRDRGAFAVIGRGAAVGVAFRRFRIHGFLAWVAWLLIHLLFLIGFRNRLSVLINWAYSFLTLRRHARLITGLPFGGEPRGPS